MCRAKNIVFPKITSRPLDILVLVVILPSDRYYMHIYGLFIVHGRINNIKQLFKPFSWRGGRGGGVVYKTWWKHPNSRKKFRKESVLTFMIFLKPIRDELPKFKLKILQSYYFCS